MFQNIFEIHNSWKNQICYFYLVANLPLFKFELLYFFNFFLKFFYIYIFFKLASRQGCIFFIFSTHILYFCMAKLCMTLYIFDESIFCFHFFPFSMSSPSSLTCPNFYASNLFEKFTSIWVVAFRWCLPKKSSSSEKRSR